MTTPPESGRRVPAGVGFAIASALVSGSSRRMGAMRPLRRAAMPCPPGDGERVGRLATA
jgi:hypothetical protein